MARPLHPVEQAAILAAGEAVHGERAQDVTAEPLAAVASARVVPDARVERAAFEEGAAPPPLERLGIAQAPLHLGGLRRGEGVLRGQVLVVTGQDLRRPANHAREDRLHLLVPRLGDGEVPRRTVASSDEDAIGDDGVEVDVQVERPAEALDGGDATCPRIDRTQPPRGPPLPGEDGPGEHVEQARDSGRGRSLYA
jgi:hypothetical protein